MDSEIEGSGLPITRTASANQNIADKISLEKPEEWAPCLAHKLMKHSDRTKDWWIAIKKKINVSNNAKVQCSLMMRLVS